MQFTNPLHLCNGHVVDILGRCLQMLLMQLLTSPDLFTAKTTMLPRLLLLLLLLLSELLSGKRLLVDTVDTCMG